MLYGILSSLTNTGLDSELESVFVAPLRVESNQPSFVQESLNLRVRASTQDIQRWEITAQLHPENGTAAMLIHTVRNTHMTVFPVRMPQVAVKSLSSNTTSTATAAVGENVVSVAAAISTGEFINIGSDPKVYLVVDNTVASITVRPPLRVAVTNGATIKAGGNVTMLARYNTDVQLGITFTDGVLSDPGSIKFVEALA